MSCSVFVLVKTPELKNQLLAFLKEHIDIQKDLKPFVGNDFNDISPPTDEIDYQGFCRSRFQDRLVGFNYSSWANFLARHYAYAITIWLASAIPITRKFTTTIDGKCQRTELPFFIYDGVEVCSVTSSDLIHVKNRYILENQYVTELNGLYLLSNKSATWTGTSKKFIDKYNRFLSKKITALNKAYKAVTKQ